MSAKTDDARVRVTAPNGVTWRRRPGGSSTGAQFLRALDEYIAVHDISRRWNWWQEGREEQEREALWAIVSEWDNGAPAATCEDDEAFLQEWNAEWERKRQAEAQRRADIIAASYDEDRVALRLRILRTEADQAFFAHVLEAPATPGQREAAERRVADSLSQATKLRRDLGDPEEVVDGRGYLPAERRERSISSHMQFWRYPSLRKLATTDRRRFTALLRMPMPEPGAMCSECEAPAEWHGYCLSLCLFRAPPPAGSAAEATASLLPGWWERCSACSFYQIEHRWGGPSVLPDFDGDQWAAMLPPLLRSIFTKVEPKPKARRKPRAKPQPLLVIPAGPIGEVTARLAEAQAQYPTAQVRPGDGASWELWPS